MSGPFPGSSPIAVVGPMSFTTRGSALVVPRRSFLNSRVLQQHPFWGFFMDDVVEQRFQTYYRDEKQGALPWYMVYLVLAASAYCAYACVGISVTITAEEPLVFADIIGSGPSNGSRRSMLTFFEHEILWLDNSIFLFITIMSYIAALACAFYLSRYQGGYKPRRFPLDQFQLFLVLYCQFVSTPVVLVTVYGIQVHAAFMRHSMWADDSKLTALLSVQYIDGLFFFLLVALSVAICLLRLQFFSFLVLAIEYVIITTVVMGQYFTVVPWRWAIWGMFVSLLIALSHGAWSCERSSRKDFEISACLAHENRRLSNQNIEMKEELSGKLQYHLHYEMGDILRILCQIKLKMTQAEKRDIDKIITALVTNEDLFEVSFDPSTAEHEDEVQGWLHMMAFRAPVSQQYRSTSSRLAVAHKASPSQPHVVYAHSRRLSRNIQTEARCAREFIQTLTVTQIVDEQETFARWLFDSLRNTFFVDMFYIDQQCTAPLQAVLVACVELNDFVSLLSLDINKLTDFAAAIENHYFKRNPYHNALHAAAVVADINFYLRRINLDVDDTTFFVGLIAGAAHDMSHPGVSNGFLIATKSKLAITYSDDSILERMHIAELYRILSHDKFDIFGHLPNVTRTQTRKLLIQMILATDLSRHFAHVTKLKSRKFAVADEARGLEVSLIMETVLMLADLGHTAKPFEYHERWARLISEEFYRQGDAELRQNLTVSPLCDRLQANLPKSQVTFLTLLAGPLFETAGQAFAIDEFEDVRNDLQANIRMWQSLIGRTASEQQAAITTAAKSDQEESTRPVEPVTSTPIQEL